MDFAEFFGDADELAADAAEYGLSAEDFMTVIEATSSTIAGIKNRFGLATEQVLAMLFPADQEFKLPTLNDDGSVTLLLHLPGREPIEMVAYPSDRVPENLQETALRPDGRFMHEPVDAQPEPKPGKFGWGGYL